MLKIDWQSGIPAYDQIVQGFIKLIAIGAMGARDKMPSVRSMAAKLGVNPNTVQKAYLILEEKGIIYSVAGKGSFVSDGHDAIKTVIENFKDQLEKTAKELVRLGLSKDELFEIIDKAYKEGGKEK